MKGMDVMRKCMKKGSIWIILIALLFVGCSTSKGNIEPVSIQEIWDKIGQSVDVSDMRKGDDGDLKDLYDIDAAAIEEYVLYMPPSNIKANEICIVKARDLKDVKSIKEKLSKRVETIGNSFKDYIPEEYHLVEKHVVNSRHSYVIFIISDEAEQIEKIFNDSFK